MVNTNHIRNLMLYKQHKNLVRSVQNIYIKLVKKYYFYPKISRKI